jgi:hypothetical protein
MSNNFFKVPNRAKIACTFLLLLTIVVLSDLVEAQTRDDARPVIDDSKMKQEVPVDPKLPTLFIVGDSTLKSDAPLRG